MSLKSVCELFAYSIRGKLASLSNSHSILSIPIKHKPSTTNVLIHYAGLTESELKSEPPQRWSIPLCLTIQYSSSTTSLKKFKLQPLETYVWLIVLCCAMRGTTLLNNCDCESY